MKLFSNSNKILTPLNILCFLYIVFFLFAYGICIIYDPSSFAKGTFIIDTFCFFTRQTGFLGLIWIIFIFLKKKKIISYLSVIVFTDFFYVNTVKIILFNSFVGWSGDAWWLTVDIVNHLVLFMFIVIIFVLILTPKNIETYTVKINLKNLLSLLWIPSTLFFILSIIVNFNKVWYDGKWQYYSIYGFYTNYNPANDGNLLILLFIPAFILLIYIFGFFTYKIFIMKDKYEFEENKFNNEINKYKYYYFKLDYLLYICSFICFLSYGFYFAIQLLSDFKLFNILQSINICFIAANILILCYIIYFVYKYKTNYFIRILVVNAMIYMVIFFIGAFLEIILKGKITEILADTCITYGLLIIFFISFSFLFIHKTYTPNFMVE